MILAINPLRRIPCVRKGAPNLATVWRSVEAARHAWAAGMRALTAIAFAIALILLPRPTLGAVLMLFAAYVTADGVLAIASAVQEMRRGAACGSMMLEGATNLLVATAILIWPATAMVAFVHLTSAWAVITGGLLLATARRLPLTLGRTLLSVAGLFSAMWGTLAAALGPSASGDPKMTAWWLIGYALPFALILLAVSRQQMTHEQRQL